MTFSVESTVSCRGDGTVHVLFESLTFTTEMVVKLRVPINSLVGIIMYMYT